MNRNLNRRIHPIAEANGLSPKFHRKRLKVMIQDLIMSYVCNGVKTTLTIEDEHYDNMPYKLADMFEKVIRESDANPQIVIENLKNAFEYD